MKESRYLAGTTTPKTQPLKGDMSLFIEVCLGPGGGGTGGGGPGATMDWARDPRGRTGGGGGGGGFL